VLAADYPRAGGVDEEAEASFGPVIGIVDAVRNIRGEMNVPFKVALTDVEIGSLTPLAEATVREELGRIERLANARAVVHPAGRPPGRRGASAAAVGAGFEVRVGLSGAVDFVAETARIDKEIGKLDQELASLEKKLANPGFVSKAPPEVVEKDRARADELREKRSKLDAHRAMLAGTEAHAARRETVENQNEQKPPEPSQASQTATAAVETAEKIGARVAEAAKAMVAAGSDAIDKVVETVKAARKPARKAMKKLAKRVARKPAKKGAPKPAKKAAKKAPARKAARKPARKAKKARR
jgi:valyl-tRNA synthetase